jgi:hypothetical protein
MVTILCCFALIALVDLIPIIRRRLWRTLIAFLALYIPALTVSILLALKVNVPSTMIMLDKALKAIGLSY